MGLARRPRLLPPWVPVGVRLDARSDPATPGRRRRKEGLRWPRSWRVLIVLAVFVALLTNLDAAVALFESLPAGAAP